jgi:hypothetical protein
MKITGTRHTADHWIFDTDDGKKVFGREAMTEEEALELLTNPPLDGFKAERITAIKSEAQARIYTKVPAWKQTNLLARSIELRDIKEERSWTAEEAAQDAAIKALWAAVKQIRLDSDTAETAVNAAETIEEINAVQF